MIQRKQVRKLIGGVRRYGFLRTITGVIRLLRFKILNPQKGTISTITDKLIVHFEYPRQFIGSLLLFRELIEPEYQFLRKALCKMSVFFDVGGGIGTYSMCAATVVSGPIHTFEPLEENLQTIRTNLIANKMDSKVRLNAAALSGSEGFGYITRCEDAFVSKLENLSKEYSDGSVKVTTIDSYCEKNGIESIDVIKIDVEGHEPEVINGAANLISNKRIGVIILETDHRLERFYRSLQDRGGFHFFYYNYRKNSLEELLPVCERTLLKEPSAFSSNIILIQQEKLETYRDRFNAGPGVPSWKVMKPRS